MGKMYPSPHIVYFLFTKIDCCKQKMRPSAHKRSTGILNCPIQPLVGVGWGKNPHPIIVVYLIISVDLFKPLRQEIGWTYRQKKGWLVRTTLLRYSAVFLRFRLSFVASKLTFTRNCTTSSGALRRSTEIQWSLFM